MKRLIQHGGSVTSRALRTAAECGRLDCVKFLLSWAHEYDMGKFVDGPSMREGLGGTLCAASFAWRDEIAEALLESGKIDQVAMNRSLHTAILDQEDFDDPDSVDPVFKSYDEGREKGFELVRLLLNAGTDINSRDKHDGSFPLHKAARLGSRARDVVALLLQKGADVNRYDEDGKTALFYAVQRDDLSIVKELIERGSSVDAIDHHDGYTPLQVSTLNIISACQSIVSFLLAKGASPTAQAAENEPPLHHACRNGNLVAVKVLLDFEHKLIEAKSSRDWIALHFAACGPTAEQCIAVSKLLLARGADIEVRDVAGWTLLHRAIAGVLSDFIDFIWFLVVDKDAAVNVSKNLAGSGLLPGLSFVPCLTVYPRGVSPWR